MSLIDRILQREEFIENPPVLMDIGAAGAIHPKWKRIAQYSVCIAFDADNRKMGYTRNEKSGYRELYVYHSIATDGASANDDFYLTKLPQCSSRLRPKQESLDNWSIAKLFHVERMVKLKTTKLSSVLKELAIAKIDWFKTDSQGTDLRLFATLGAGIIERALSAEFEPGIIDAYEGEDKLWALMAFMEQQPFWMHAIKIGVAKRLHINVRNALAQRGKTLNPDLLKASPGWAEVSYLHTFPANAPYLDKRDYLLGWVFSIMERQYGFALEVSAKGYKRFGDDIFLELETDTLKRIKRSYWNTPMALLKTAAKRLLRRAI